MSTQNKVFTSYTLDDHPNPDACYDWIRNNWHDLAQYNVEEGVDSLKAFADQFDCDLDYCISPCGDRGDFIKLQPRGEFWCDDTTDYHDVQLYVYWRENGIMKDGLLDGKCPLTGMCYDENLLDAVRYKKKGETFQEIMDDAGHRLLKAIYAEGDYTYSGEGLREMCECNNYYFYADGSIA